MTDQRRLLVVGAGFAGAVHARIFAEHGYEVHVIDRRHHVAGNAFDEVSAEGTRVHRYGPHLFHTNNVKVVEWLKKFADFEPYVHRVVAALGDSRYVPLPINRTTINEVFSVRLTSEQDAAQFLSRQAVPCDAPHNAAEYLYSRIGTILTDLFFRPYSRKMWAMDLEDMHEAVVRRIPLRLDDNDRYFPDDAYQMLPKNGYTNLVSNILDHDNISIKLNHPYHRTMSRDYFSCFNSMPIDEYFDYRFGALPYRSIKFHSRREHVSYEAQASVVNFTDDGIFTRETDWSALPNHQTVECTNKTVTREQPCDYLDNDMERYYPVKTNDDRYRKTYQKYVELSEQEPRMNFIGRCGTYQYLDMDQVINQSMRSAEKWLRDISQSL